MDNLGLLLPKKCSENLFLSPKYRLLLKTNLLLLHIVLLLKSTSVINSQVIDIRDWKKS